MINRFVLVASAVAFSGAAFALPLNPDVRRNHSADDLREGVQLDGPAFHTSYTGPIKSRLMRKEGIRTCERSVWALDHHIPIALGGHPRRLENLQLLTQHDNSRKSRIEVKMLCYVCGADSARPGTERGMG